MEVTVQGPGTFAVDVVGVAKYQRVLGAAADAGAIHEVLLVLENANPYDDQAVAVELDGARCGYLSRAHARLYRANLSAVGEGEIAVRCKAKIVGGFETATGERAHFGLRLDLPPWSK